MSIEQDKRAEALAKWIREVEGNGIPITTMMRSAYRDGWDDHASKSPTPIDSAKVEDTGEYANRMLSYELAGVIVDTETHGFDDACLATIKRVHDALLNATTVPIAQATGEADGWKLVPIKPTDDMAKAGKDQWYKTFTQHDLYVAMVSAAPTPSTQAVGEPVNFPYQKTFNAIAAATSVCAGCVAISVIDFREAFGEANAQVPMTDATPERKLTVDLVVLVMKLMRHLPKGDPESDKAMKLLKDNGFIHTYRLADKS
jgi:hypothetical protein